MAMEYGRAMMARDIGLERKELEEEEAELQKEMEKQAKAQQKKGMWGSVGRTLGTIATGALLTPFMGPGALMAAKMVGGYAGGRLGQGLGGTEASKAGLKIDSKGNFLGSERRALGRAAETARSDFDLATKGMRNQLAFSSVANPLMSYVGGGGKFTKEGLGERFTEVGEFKDAPNLAGAQEWHRGNIWEQLAAQPELSSFLPQGQRDED